MNAPFTRSQDCSVTSGIEQFGKAALTNLEAAGEEIVSAAMPLLDAASPPWVSLSPARRTLKSGSFDCDSSTDLSVSVGNSHTQSLNVSTPDDPAIIDGDGDMFLFMVQDILLSYTNVLIAQAAVSTETKPTQYIDSAVNGPLPPSPDFCQVVIPFQKTTASSSENSQLVWISQWTIKHELIPYSEIVARALKMANGNGPMDKVTQTMYDALVTNRDNWQAVLNYSQSLKDNAVPWPELLQQININEKASSFPTGQLRADYSVPLYLDGEDLVVSFYGGMGGIGFSIDNDADQSISNSRSTDRSGSSDLSVSVGLSAAGFGVDYSVDMDYSNSQSAGGSADSDVSSSRSMSFDFGDPDRGDAFDVIIRRDTVYGTPVFITRSGRSRCKWEANTVAREILETSWNASLSSITVYPSATFFTTLRIDNIHCCLEHRSATRSFDV